jgi:hypothetical protein
MQVTTCSGMVSASLFWNQRTNANLKKRPTREKTGNT